MPDQSLKIGIVCYPTFGGSGAVATELGRLLARRGHEIHFISYSRPFRLIDDFHENIYYHEISNEQYPLFMGPLYGISAAVKIQEVVRSMKLDLLHMHYALPHAISAKLAMEMLQPAERVPVLTTLHGTDITLVGRKPSFKPAVQLGLQHSTALTCVSFWLREVTCKEFNLCEQSTIWPEVIYNFIDPEVFNPENAKPCRRSHFATPDEKILMHISNFRPVKRVGDVVEIFARVAEQMPAKLLMLGDGPDQELAQRRAQELGVGERVKFLGNQSGVEHFLPIADLFLFPSAGESFGLAALEALACGVPVVGAQAGGLPEVVIDGECGYLRPTGDVAAMGEAALAILGNDALHARMAKTGRARVLANFDAEQIIPQYEQLYYRLLEKEVKYANIDATYKSPQL